jgi:hypothetical protein
MNLVNESTDALISDSCVGLEVELESLPMGNSTYERGLHNYWEVTDDPSLRHFSGSCYEFRFKGPLWGQDVVNAITDLDKTLGGRYSKGDRTSVHVHLDVRDLNFNQLKRLLVCYLLVEPIIFNNVRRSRRFNPYCVPVSMTPNYLKDLTRVFSGISSNDFQTIIANRQGYKYSALNFRPLNSFGSIEFRHKEGSGSAEDLINWVNVILAFKRFATKGGDIDTGDIIHIVDNYDNFLEELFEGVNIYTNYSSEDFRKVSSLAKQMSKETFYDKLNPMNSPRRYDPSSNFWSVVGPDVAEGAIPEEGLTRAALYNSLSMGEDWNEPETSDFRINIEETQ